MSRLTGANELVAQAHAIKHDTHLWQLLGTLGTVYQTGSVVHKLMVKPDLDFEIQTNSPNFDDAIALVPKLVKTLGADSVKITNFEDADSESAYYFVGCDFMYEGRRWHVDATVKGAGELDRETLDLLAPANDMQKETILELKSELMNTKRYAGAQSNPPYTFRSVHIYDAVMNGGISSVRQLEDYFNPK